MLMSKFGILIPTQVIVRHLIVEKKTKEITYFFFNHVEQTSTSRCGNSQHHPR